jgi:hypothetical protein
MKNQAWRENTHENNKWFPPDHKEGIFFRVRQSLPGEKFTLVLGSQEKFTLVWGQDFPNSFPRSEVN